MLNKKEQHNVLVSIVMCVYNTNQEYLNQAVASILNQTYTNIELFIVDDCSKKDLYQPSIFKDKRIKLLRNENNMGPSFSRNKALKIASGEYIAIMDSDDISLPSRIEEQVAFLNGHPEYVACGTWFQHIGAKNNIVKREIDDNEYYRCCLLFGNVPTLLNSSMMIRRNILIENDISFDDTLRIGEDYKMWVQLSRLGKMTNVKKVLVQYRIHEGQVTNNNKKNKKSLKYDAIVKCMQLDCISPTFTDSEKYLFSLNFLDKKVKPYEYFKLLQKIIYENNKSLFFEEEALKHRVNEQWEKKIFSIHNPFTFVRLKLKLPSESKNISLIKRKQILNHLRR